MELDVTGMTQVAVEAVSDGEELAFRVERQAHNRGLGHSLARDRLAGNRVPDHEPALDSRHVEAPSRGDELTVRTDRHGLDRPRQAVEDAPLLPGLDAPEPDLAVIAL